MEWRRLSDSYWELRVDGRLFATVWRGIECCWWAIQGAEEGWPEASMDDAKDAAWAAVYRSTR